MKKDSDIIRDFLLALIRDPDSADTPPSGDVPSAPPSIDMGTEAAPSDLLGQWDAISSELPELLEFMPELEALEPNVSPVHPLGELSAVQDRFQTLLKKRLRSEIERRPLLFPWEKSVQEYPDFVEDSAVVWLNQLRDLAIPAVLPDDVLTVLLERCQQLAQESLKSGLKLIQAVEGLFPDQPQTLENIARMVMTPAYRSQAALETPQIDYDQANPQQRIALAMLAAQEILSTLVLEVSAEAPAQEREWSSEAGPVVLSVTLVEDHLEVRSTLPTGGYLRLASGGSVRTERSQGGLLVLPLDLTGSTSYPLEVGLSMAESQPLQFVVRVLTEPSV